MEAQGPTTRRGNQLAPEGRAGLAPTRNLRGNAGTAAGPDGTASAGGRGASDPSRSPAIAAATGSAPRATWLKIGPRASLLKELIETIGIDGASRLIAAFGGLRIYIPHTPQPDDTLSETVGYQTALTLAKSFGGDSVEIPNPTARGPQIIELRASGVSINDIARSQHCTRRRVYQVLAEARRARSGRETRPPQ